MKVLGKDKKNGEKSKDTQKAEKTTLEKTEKSTTKTNGKTTKRIGLHEESGDGTNSKKLKGMMTVVQCSRHPPPTWVPNQSLSDQGIF